MFVSFLYMFWVTMCPSSGGTTVFMRHLVLVILYAGWNSTLHPRQSSIQNNKYQVLHKYSRFSWWWAHSRPKCVEKRNKHTKKNFAPSWLYLQDYTGMHGQQNIIFEMQITVMNYITIPSIRHSHFFNNYVRLETMTETRKSFLMYL
jgi:hypothetical protein